MVTSLETRSITGCDRPFLGYLQRILAYAQLPLAASLLLSSERSHS
ncbi:hypothetical protein H6F77_01790 [Microcoleus sp. FACHB-831]|nr:hypothetical protein [Microcoleus sp. FACHB-831]MBD1919851.1 hypothetical protein [Microcoleus sp. FACHB-831]